MTWAGDSDGRPHAGPGACFTLGVPVCVLSACAALALVWGVSLGRGQFRWTPATNTGLPPLCMA